MKNRREKKGQTLMCWTRLMQMKRNLWLREKRPMVARKTDVKQRDKHVCVGRD